MFLIYMKNMSLAVSPEDSTGRGRGGVSVNPEEHRDDRGRGALARLALRWIADSDDRIFSLAHYFRTERSWRNRNETQVDIEAFGGFVLFWGDCGHGPIIRVRGCCQAQ